MVIRTLLSAFGPGGRLYGWRRKVSNTDSISAERLSLVIDDIYGCVLDRRRWFGVLGTLCELLGGCAASLNIHNLSSQTPELLIEHGTDPAASEAYVREYAAINPLIEATLLYTPQGTVSTIYRVIDMTEYRRSRFYKEWVAPQEWGDWMGVLLTRTLDSMAMLAISRLECDGGFTDAEIGSMHLLLPHLERATMLGRLFDDRLAEREGMAALINRIRAAAFLVDRMGRIAFANAAGERLLAEGSVFRARSRELAAVSPAAQRMLSKALAEPGAEPMSTIVQTDDGRRALSVIPAHAESGDYAIVMLTVPSPDLPLPGPALMEAYGLTAAEIRVLVALLKRRTVAQMADELGVTQRTIKAHLQRLFEKTGTQRQSDLVGEILSLAPPMRLFE